MISREIFPIKNSTSNASPQFALPVINQVSTQYTAQTSVAGTDFTIPAGGAGTAVTIHLPFGQVLGNYGRVGTFYDSGLSFTGAMATTFTTEVNFIADSANTHGDTSTLSNGQYMVDYETGIIYGKKADAGTTGNAVYKTWIASSSAPVGGATAANQVLEIADLDSIKASATSIDTKLTNPLPVSASSLPLPTGAATSAKQDTGNTSVASIDGKTPALGQALAASSVPVVLTAAQVTTLTPPAAITGFATETTLASIKDTAGIKKITDALPAGTNTIGKVLIGSSLIPAAYDYISLGYTGSNLTTAVYKTGGAGGSTVGTLTLAYTGSVLDTITKT